MVNASNDFQVSYLRSDSPDTCPAAFNAPPMPSNNSLSARDRVLLYARGLNMDPVLSVELALESMRRAAPAVDTCTVINELQKLMGEHGIALSIVDTEGQKLSSTPPMNRRPMIAQELDRHPILTDARKFFQKLHDKKLPKNSVEK